MPLGPLTWDTTPPPAPRAIWAPASRAVSWWGGLGEEWPLASTCFLPPFPPRKLLFFPSLLTFRKQIFSPLQSTVVILQWKFHIFPK